MKSQLSKNAPTLSREAIDKLKRDSRDKRKGLEKLKRTSKSDLIDKKRAAQERRRRR